MRTRIITAVALAVALAIPASTASGGTTKASASSITVWLMSDAQNGWPAAVANATSQFKSQHPGVDVNVQYQSWDSVLQKFDASIAAGDTPDVIELGNSQTAKYMAAGAFQAYFDSGPANPELFERLRALRKRLADAEGVPAYIVFSDAVLRQMASRVPKSPAEMLALSGVGPVKLERYGEAFLEVLREA